MEATSPFESAVEAIVSGNTAVLQELLDAYPALIRERSSRSHHAALIHYVGANGVEDERQQTPANAVEILNVLLKAGAEVDATADLYGGGATTLGLAATSFHPAKAGVLIPLLETLLRAGAVIDYPTAGGNGQNAVNACLHNGRPQAAHFLAGRGAILDLEGVSGVGRLDEVKAFFDDDGRLKPPATKTQMASGFMWACEYGHTDVVDFLLDKGVDIGIVVNGMTGLHWAIVGGRLATVHRLIARKAALGIKNRYGGTPLETAHWAAVNHSEVGTWPKGDDYALIIEALEKAGGPATS